MERDRMMRVKNKTFTNCHLDKCEVIKKKSADKFGLNPVNNICLILQKVEELAHISGNYVECGTYSGNTIIPVAIYCLSEGLFQDNRIVGMDSFCGFPCESHDKRDLPSYFNELYDGGLISIDHFEKAKLRTDNFTDTSHLEGDYFLDVNEVFSACNSFDNVDLIKGNFDDTTESFSERISILHLDCDLYSSYMSCLRNLYDNVLDGGVIIFDEYYSFKYPGARVAVDEFFRDKSGNFEKYVTGEGHERWCFVKGANEAGV